LGSLFIFAQLTWLKTGQAGASDDAFELGWWEAKLWRPNWMGSTRSWAAIDQKAL
jgi:hypothetical protein